MKGVSSCAIHVCCSVYIFISGDFQSIHHRLNRAPRQLENSIDCFTIQINYNFDTVKLAYIKDQIIQYYAEFQGENLVIANNFSQQENIYYLYICMIPIFVQGV